MAARSLFLNSEKTYILKAPIHVPSGNGFGAFASLLVLLTLSAPIVCAATSTKQNNNAALNLAASWDAFPGHADVAQWTSAVTAANNPSLGADLSLLGLKIVNPGGLVTLGAGNTLTLGASGVDLATASQDLILNCGLTLQGQQSWKAAAGRSVNIAGTFTRNAATVDFTNFNSSAILGTLANDASGILGSWATTGAATSLNYVQSSAGVLSAYSAQTVATAANFGNVTNPLTNYSFAAAATQVGAVTANTLRFTGSGGISHHSDLRVSCGSIIGRNEVEINGSR